MASDQGKRRRGGIRERAGVYQVRVYVGLDPVTGERVDLAGTAATEREAEKLLTQFLAERTHGAPPVAASPSATPATDG